MEQLEWRTQRQQRRRLTAGKKSGLVMGLLVGGGAGRGGGDLRGRAEPRPKAAVAADSAGEQGEADGEAGAKGEHEGKEGASKLIKLENIIVNPAGSQGSRFLMASVVLAVGTSELETDLQAREVELRDKVTSVLEVMNMAQLTAPGARDTVKARVSTMVTEMVGGKPRFQVYLPQFVIQ